MLQRHTSILGFGLAFGVLGVGVVAAEGCSATPATTVGTGGAGGGASSTGSHGGQGGGGGGNIIPDGTIVVTPADITIDIQNGATAGKSVTFKAEIKQAGGMFVPVNNCIWSLENVDLGALNGSTFDPSGKAGGATTVTCTVGMASGVAKVTVNLHGLDNPAGLDPPTLGTLLGSMTNDPNIGKLLYPYDATIFPRGLSAAPELMWDAPAANDIYAVEYKEPYVDYTAVFNAPQPGRFQPPLTEWSKLLASNPGKQVTVTLYRLAGGKGGTPYRGPIQTWTLSTANLKGTVYFWRVISTNSGDVVKMPFSQPPATFLQSGGQCTGCHAVSHNGAVVAAAVSASGFAGSYESGTGKQNFSTGIQSGYRAVAPDASVIAWVPTYGNNNYLGEPVELADALTGAKIAPSGLENFGLTSTPEFSPDGKLLAMSIRNPPYDGSQHNIFRDSDLGLADFDLANKKATNLRVLLKASAGEALVFPSFTPDNKHVIFQRGNQARARNVDISSYGPPFAWTTQASHAELWSIDVDGMNLVKLTNANDGGIAAGEEQRSFHPIMSPVVQGGYFWVVFTGMRKYGNRLVDTPDYDWTHCSNNNFADCRHKQLWVAAIDPNAKAGVDPSHPAFWLPGQDVANQNFDAYWALDPCKKMGDSCDVGFECCDGTCRSVNGKKTCDMPMGCGNAGDVCKSGADCCGGEVCIGGVCDVIVAK